MINGWAKCSALLSLYYQFVYLGQLLSNPLSHLDREETHRFFCTSLVRGKNKVSPRR